MGGDGSFARVFRELTGFAPMPWQEALYGRFLADRHDNIPAVCDLPTGLGKTAVVAIWLIALAQPKSKMPRRLVYVVNRRTVVDQMSRSFVQRQLFAKLTKLRRRTNGEDSRLRHVA